MGTRAHAQGQKGENEFIRLTCIESLEYLKIEYASVPGTDNGGSNSQSQEHPNSEWEEFGFFDANHLNTTCNIGNSKYRISTKNRTESCQYGYCESSPIAITVANDDGTFVQDLILGPNGERGISAGSIELIAGYPVAIRLCLFPTMSEGREPCHFYNPWLGQDTLLPPVTQDEFAEFVQLRSRRTLAPANATKAFERSSASLSEFLELRYPCKFPNLTLGTDVSVYAVAPGKSVASSRMLAFRLDRRPHSYQIDVVVNAPGKKVALLFTGYETVVWNIRWSPNTEIVAAASFGGGIAAFAGLPKSVPTFSGHFGSGYACREVSRARTIPSYSKLLPQHYQLIDEMSSSIYGRTPDAVFLGGDRLVVGDPLNPDVRLLQSSETPVESFNRFRPPATPEEALATAVKNGLLRPATSKDVRDWLTAVKANQEVRQVAKDWQPILFNAFVVQQPFNLPASLFGIYTFFVPKGVPSPTGARGHAVILDFNSLKCSGPQDNSCGYF